MHHFMATRSRLAIWLCLALSLVSLPLVAGAQNADQQNSDMGATYAGWAYGEGFPPACRDGEPVAGVYVQLSDQAIAFLTRYCASNADPSGLTRPGAG